jgi:hypothetical protein
MAASGQQELGRSACRRKETVAGYRAGPGSGKLPAERTALFALAAAAGSETSLPRRDNEDPAFAGRWLFRAIRGRWASCSGRRPWM